ncbi:hypothetical protein HYV10_00465 [Candidatus Dependentiae bacterium]|nr:hypothetical protein [Candidatus Dependentiae bacterium]
MKKLLFMLTLINPLLGNYEEPEMIIDDIRLAIKEKDFDEFIFLCEKYIGNGLEDFEDVVCPKDFDSLYLEFFLLLADGNSEKANDVQYMIKKWLYCLLNNRTTLVQKLFESGINLNEKLYSHTNPDISMSPIVWIMNYAIEERLVIVFTLFNSF